MRRSLRLVWLAGPVLGGLVVTSLSMALAAPVDYADGNDTFGRLDVMTVEFTADPNPPTWTIHTFASWTARDIKDSGFLVVLLDTRVVPPPPTWSGHDRRAHHGPKEGPRRGDHVRGPRQAPDRAPQDVVLLVVGDPVHRAVVSSNMPRSRPGRRSGRAGAPTTFALPVAFALALAEPQPHADALPDRLADVVTGTARRCRGAASRRARWRSRGARELPRARR